MSFPLTFKYSTQLHKQLSDKEASVVLDYIGEEVGKRSAEDIEIDNSSLTFKSSFLGPRWNWNIMAPIEKGKLTLENSDNRTLLTYEIFMYRLAIIATVLSVIGGISTGSIWVGVYFFTGLYGLNWITAVMRHKSMFNDIVRDVQNRMKTKLDSVE